MFPRKSFIVRCAVSLTLVCIACYLWISSTSLKQMSSSHPKTAADISNFIRTVEQRNNNLQPQVQVKLFKNDSQNMSPANKPNVSVSIGEHGLVLGEDNTNMTAEELELISEHDAYVNISQEELKLALEGNVVNPHDFKYIINTERICSSTEIFMIIYIHSAPDHFRRRNVIRETWANPSIFEELSVRTIFLVGKTSSDQVQKTLLMESNMYGDVIQEDYVDSYKNLTYKGIQGLKWISTYCRHATYVLKTDDDIFVNIFNLVSHLNSLRRHGIGLNNTIMCNVWTTMVVMRDKKSKWYVSQDEFKGDTYPTYCSGSAYIFTTDLIPKMYFASKTTKFFWVDDFYITGLLAQKVNASFYNLNSLYVLNANTVVKEFTSGDNWTWVFGHIHGLDKMYYVWKKITEKLGKAFAR